MDGLDGLVAGVCIIQLSFLSLWYGQPGLWLWVAALAGFLIWNWTPAKIFMGDAGSTALGAIIGVSLLSPPSDEARVPWTILVILFPLVGDAIYTLFYRLIRGENIFTAHRIHIYQRLHQAGWTHGQVASLYIGLTLMTSIGVAQFGPPMILLLSFLLLLSIVGAEIYLTYMKRKSM